MEALVTNDAEMPLFLRHHNAGLNSLILKAYGNQVLWPNGLSGDFAELHAGTHKVVSPSMFTISPDDAAARIQHFDRGKSAFGTQQAGRRFNQIYIGSGEDNGQLSPLDSI